MNTLKEKIQAKYEETERIILALLPSNQGYIPSNQGYIIGVYTGELRALAWALRTIEDIECQ